ncbi:hypothetical protein [Streptomyces sp. NPDC088135]|uniref:hypothetical protein n=1 Tax=Streptomyces sp. NPDC088135 TaxID=3160993 RepID=UPI00341D274D
MPEWAAASGVTAHRHVRELRQVREYTEFAEAEAELRAWVDARAWTCSAALDREEMACSRVS